MRQADPLNRVIIGAMKVPLWKETILFELLKEKFTNLIK